MWPALKVTFLHHTSTRVSLDPVRHPTIVHELQGLFNCSGTIRTIGSYTVGSVAAAHGIANGITGVIEQ